MVAPLIAAAGISAASSVLSGVAGGKGAKKAAKVTAAAQDRTNALTASIYNQNVANLTPYMERGNAAGGQVNALLGLDPGGATAANNAFATFRDSSGYQNKLDAASKAVNTGYAARGALESGAAQKALQSNASNLAGDYFSQYLGALQGQQATGLSGANALAGVVTNYADTVAATNMNSAATQANAALAGTYSTQNALAGIAKKGQDIFGSSYGAGSGGSGNWGNWSQWEGGW